MLPLTFLQLTSWIASQTYVLQHILPCKDKGTSRWFLLGGSLTWMRPCDAQYQPGEGWWMFSSPSRKFKFRSKDLNNYCVNCYIALGLRHIQVQIAELDNWCRILDADVAWIIFLTWLPVPADGHLAHRKFCIGAILNINLPYSSESVKLMSSCHFLTL